LVRRNSGGCNYIGSIDQHLCCPPRASESALAEHGVFMKDITAVLLAIVFVLYSLIALLSVERNQDSTSSPLVRNQEKISELGLRVAFRR
jgi:hypothetical protein